MTTEEYTQKKEEILENCHYLSTGHFGCQCVDIASKAIDELIYEFIGLDDLEVIETPNTITHSNGAVVRNSFRKDLRKIIGGK